MAAAAPPIARAGTRARSNSNATAASVTSTTASTAHSAVRRPNHASGGAAAPRLCASARGGRPPTSGSRRRCISRECCGHNAPAVLAPGQGNGGQRVCAGAAAGGQPQLCAPWPCPRLLVRIVWSAQCRTPAMCTEVEWPAEVRLQLKRSHSQQAFASSHTQKQAGVCEVLPRPVSDKGARARCHTSERRAARACQLLQPGPCWGARGARRAEERGPWARTRGLGLHCVSVWMRRRRREVKRDAAGAVGRAHTSGNARGSSGCGPCAGQPVRRKHPQVLCPERWSGSGRGAATSRQTRARTQDRFAGLDAAAATAAAAAIWAGKAGRRLRPRAVVRRFHGRRRHWRARRNRGSGRCPPAPHGSHWAASR